MSQESSYQVEVWETAAVSEEIEAWHWGMLQLELSQSFRQSWQGTWFETAAVSEEIEAWHWGMLQLQLYFSRCSHLVSGRCALASFFFFPAFICPSRCFFINCWNTAKSYFGPLHLLTSVLWEGSKKGIKGN